MKKHLRYVREAYGRGEVPLEYALSVIQSYLGLMQDCNNDALRNQILETTFWFATHKICWMQQNKIERQSHRFGGAAFLCRRTQ